MKLNKFAAFVAAAAIFTAGCQTGQKKGEESEKVDQSLVGKLVDHKTYYSDGSLMGEGKALYKAVFSKPVRIKQGPWVQYFKGSKNVKQAEGEYKDDKQVGVWKFYSKEGIVQQEGPFVDNIPSGEWSGYYPSGELSWKARYSVVDVKDEQTGEMKKVGQINGVKTSFFKSGKVWKEDQMANNKKNGRCQEYYENGGPKEIASYKDDLKNGPLNEYWPNNKVKTQGTFTIGNKIDPRTKAKTDELAEIKTGMWKMCYSNGQPAIEGSFSENKPHGQWKFYSREGQVMKEGKYTDGKEDGNWSYYEYDNNRRMISMELSVEAGMISDKISRVYENGKIIGEGNLKRIPPKALFQMYKDGKPAEIIEGQNQPDDDEANKITSKWTGKWKPVDRNGPWTEFVPGTRTKKFEANYMINKLAGKYTEYYPSGKVKAEGEFLANKKNGNWTYYREDGSIDYDISGQYMSDKLFTKKKQQ